MLDNNTYLFEALVRNTYLLMSTTSSDVQSDYGMTLAAGSMMKRGGGWAFFCGGLVNDE